MGSSKLEIRAGAQNSSMKIIFISLLLTFVASQSPGLQEPPAGQRCSGRNFNGRRCCTPEQPCGLGEGDCDGPLDGGVNDGHEGCRGDLVCGSNNCKKFGSYFHEKDDCCDDPSSITARLPPRIVPGAPREPPSGQRCKGRNYPPGRRCCTPENPCGEGEGDCDGAGDGESMTATGAARLDWCAAVTTARSSELTTMRRTTAVRDQQEELVDIHPSQGGVPGQNGGVWLLELSRGNRSAGNSSAVSLTAAWEPGTLSRDTPTLCV